MGGSKKKTKKTYEDRVELPEYMRAGSEKAIGMATDRADSQYEGYGGQRIADISENERMGMDMAKQGFGQYDEDYGRARESLESIGSFTDEGVAEKFMNPYMEQVLAPQRRRQNEAFDAERASRKQKAGMQGAFGGRQSMWDNKFEQDFQQSQDELTGSAYGAAFESAQGLHGREQDRALNQADAYGGLAESQSKANRNAIMDLMNSGFVERTQDQANKDFAYIEHLENRDWDVNNLNTLVQSLAAVPHEITKSGESTTVETTKESPVKAIAGVAAMTAGAIMTGGASLAMMGGAMTQAGGALMG